MTLVEVLRRTLFPIQGVQKIIPKKQLLQSSLSEETHADTGGQGPASASLLLY